MNTKILYLSAGVFSSFFCTLFMTQNSLSEGESFPAVPLNNNHAFSGLYLIGSVGHSNLSAPRKGQLTLATAPNVGAQTGASISSHHAIFSAGVGYGVLLDSSLLLEVEALGFWDGHDKQSHTTFTAGAAALSLNENLTKKFGWEVRAKVGNLVHDKVCIYAGASLEQSSFSYKYTTNANLSGKISKKLWGGSPLAGVRFLLNDKLALDLSYKHTFYQGLSLRNTIADGSQFYRSLQPSNSIAQVALTYKIN